MRLLVYGGTEHNVRCQIGTWDLSEKGYLFDTYGIPKDSWAIGFGILDDKCFLFLKSKQSSGTRIYPFSILFDPGETVWQKFGWNAANLALSLLGKDNRFYNQLLNEPEAFGAENLEAMADSLPVYALNPQHNLISELIAGAIFEAEPITLNPRLLDADFPKIEELAANLEALPPFLRTGNGWLLGGSSENAKSLGVKLVFDGNLQRQDAARIQNILGNARRALGSLESVQRNATLAEFSKVPVWRWEKTFNQPAEEVLSRLNYLVEMSNRESISDEELLMLDEGNERVLAEDIRAILLRLACRAKKDLTPQRTKFLLEKFSLGALKTADLPTEFFDRAAYKNWLVKNRKLPSDSKLDINLSAFDSLEVCREIISGEENLENIPLLFQKSVIELQKIGGEGLIANLAETVRDKTSQKLWDVWKKYHKQDFFKKYLAGEFVGTARKSAKNMEENWENVYLRFADDRGGKWLAENVSLLQVKNFVISLLQATKSEEVQAWLQTLTVSPLRSKLSLEEKRQIARLNNELAASWRNFLSLLDLFEQKNPAVERLDSPDEDIYLRQELEELFKCNPLIEPKKMTAPLRKFFGKLPDELADELTRRGGKVASEKSKEKPKPTVSLDEKKIALAKQTIDEAVEMIHSVMSQAEIREESVSSFFFEKDSAMYKSFPYLPIKTRANILEILYQTKSADLKKEAARLFEHDKHNPFSIALWECFLLTAIGKRITADLNNGFVNKSVDLKKELAEIVEKAVEKDKWKFTDKENPVEKKSGVHNPESEKGYLGWLMFWK